MNMLSVKALVLILICCLVSCSTGPNIDTDYDPEYSFSGINSYHLVDKKRKVGDIAHSRIIKAIHSALSAKGLREADRQQADILVDFLVVTRETTRIDTYNTGYGYRCFRCSGWGGATTGIDVHQIKEGSLIIDLVDPKKKQTVWRGSSTGTIKKRSPEEKSQIINKHTSAIINSMPVGSL